MEYRTMLNWTDDVLPGSLFTFKTILKNRQVKTILEIGCFHGTSLLGFLNLFPEANATAVDTWNNTIFGELSGIDFTDVEREFDKNTADYSHRISKRKGDSKKVLRELYSEGMNYDLIYIDGSHMAFDVYHDAIYSWLLLNKNGILIFDDYTWETDKFELFIPHHAINHFLETYKGEYEMLKKEYRVFIKKL